MKFIKRRIKGQHVARRGANLTRNNTCAVSNMNTKKREKGKKQHVLLRAKITNITMVQEATTTTTTTTTATATTTTTTTTTNTGTNANMNASTNTNTTSDSEPIFLRFRKHGVGHNNDFVGFKNDFPQIRKIQCRIQKLYLLRRI